MEWFLRDLVIEKIAYLAEIFPEFISAPISDTKL